MKRPSYTLKVIRSDCSIKCCVHSGGWRISHRRASSRAWLQGPVGRRVFHQRKQQRITEIYSEIRLKAICMSCHEDLLPPNLYFVLAMGKRRTRVQRHHALWLAWFTLAFYIFGEDFTFPPCVQRSRTARGVFSRRCLRLHRWS